MAAAAFAAFFTTACGSDSPTSSSSGGVVVQGMVLSESASTSVGAADTRTAAAQAKKVTVKVEGTSLTVDVSANGTFQFTGIPSGTFTLVFLADGVEVGRVVVTAQDGNEVKIVVQVKDSQLVVVQIEVDGADQGTRHLTQHFELQRERRQAGPGHRARGQRQLRCVRPNSRCP